MLLGTKNPPVFRRWVPLQEEFLGSLLASLQRRFGRVNPHSRLDGVTLTKARRISLTACWPHKRREAGSQHDDPETQDDCPCGLRSEPGTQSNLPCGRSPEPCTHNSLPCSLSSGPLGARNQPTQPACNPYHGSSALSATLIRLVRNWGGIEPPQPIDQGSDG